MVKWSWTEGLKNNVLVELKGGNYLRQEVVLGLNTTLYQAKPETVLCRISLSTQTFASKFMATRNTTLQVREASAMSLMGSKVSAEQMEQVSRSEASGF